MTTTGKNNQGSNKMGEQQTGRKGDYTRKTLLEVMSRLGYGLEDRVTEILLQPDKITVRRLGGVENGVMLLHEDQYVLGKVSAE